MNEGKSKIVGFVGVTTTGAYADGDQIGAAVELANMMDTKGDTGAILSVSVIDSAKQKSALELLFFDASPTIASSDNAELDIVFAQFTGKYLGSVLIAASDYEDVKSVSIATVRQQGILLKGNKSASIWVVLKSKGTPTYTASALYFRVGVLQD